jgi:hypothetical protein
LVQRNGQIRAKLNSWPLEMNILNEIGTLKLNQVQKHGFLQEMLVIDIRN